MSVSSASEFETASGDSDSSPPSGSGSGGGGSLRRLAMQGAIWTIAGFGFGQVLRLASNLVLTRLLVPELFGLMTLAQTALTGLSLFSDIGASASVVRHPRGEEPSFLNTIWTIQIIRGFFLWVGTALLAWPVFWFYGDPRLKLLVPLVGLSAVLNGFMSTSPYVLNRRLAVKQLAVFEIGTQAINLVFVIGVVLVWPTIWALVLGGLLGAAARVLLSHRLLPNLRNHLAWDPSAIKELVSFGKWIFLSTATMFLGEQTDRIVLGKLLTFQMLGVYGVAANLADLPRQVSGMLNSKVIYPAISRMNQRPRVQMRSAILRNRRLPLMAAAAGLALMVGFGDMIVRFLYDPRYHQAAWMLPLLSLSTWPRILCNTSEPALYAIGRPQYSTLGSFLRFIFTLGGLYFGYSQAGLAGAVIAVCLRDLPYFLPVAWGLRREKLSVFWQDIALTVLLVGLLLVVVGFRLLLGLGVPWEGIF